MQFNTEEAEVKKLLFVIICFTNFLYADPRLEFDQTALDDYVHSIDESYEYNLIKTVSGEGYKAYIVDLTSQSYLTKSEINRTEWKHWLTIVSPDVIKHKTGMLVIGAGDNDGKVPSGPDQLSIEYAKATNSVVASLGMVPNQPLTFVGENKPRWEDAIIAYTWDKYLTTGEDKWPLRMAMTKSAVAAMDAIQSIINEREDGIEIEKFVVSGASKRGWTTWTTGGVDNRVEAIIPVVIDVLNVEPSFEHHWSVYGFWAPAIQDYVDMEIMDWWGTKEMKSLFKLIDPFSEKERFEMPKLLVNAAGDQFFIPTSSQFYFDELPGEKYLRYVPNADHNVSEGTDALETILAFYASILNKVPRPEFSWELKEDGSIEVLSEDAVKEVIMWTATNKKTRDFRKEVIGNSWLPKVLKQNEDGLYIALPSKPAMGWKAYFVEMTYETPFGLDLKLTTPVRVAPDTLPFEYEEPKKLKEGFLSDIK